MAWSQLTRPGLPRTNILALAVVVGTPRCFHEFLRESSSVQCATVKVEHSLEESQQRSYSYSYKVPNKRDFFLSFDAQFL